MWSPLPSGPLPRAGERVIDIHGHAYAREVDRLIEGRPQAEDDRRRMAEGSGGASMAHNAADMLPKAGARMASLDARLRDMDWMGIDVQLVSPAPNQYCHWAEPSLAGEITSAVNEDIAGLVARAPDRLVGLGTVSLQHPEQAAGELSEVLGRQGLKGIEISASVGTMELSDERLTPFWEAANDLGLLVFIHPLGTTLGARLDRYYLSNTVGQPTETTIGLSHLIFSGVLHRFPNIRFLAAHGGGYLPTYIGRSDHAWQVRPEARATPRPPSTYLSQIWVDTVVFDPDVLSATITAVGDDRVLFGTDYPFDMGAYRVNDMLDTLGADPRTRRRILHDNAARLLGLNGAT
ncbi:MAG: amidohydrolase family protein [Pseudomonadota bacterium]|nr:amidohydrolase family protein [Pseudomonadota bacterium]